MKVCLVAKTVDPKSGGLGRHVYELSESLSDLGHEVTVLTRQDSEVPEIDADIVKVNFLDLRQDVLNSYSSIPGLVNYLRKNSDKFDIVHGHGVIGFAQTIAKKISNDTKFLYTLHGVSDEHTSRLWLKPLARALFYPEDLAVKTADGLIAVSEDTKKKAIRKYGLSEEYLKVIHNGVNLERFRSDYEFGNKILFVGHLISRKGPEKLLETFQMLENDFPQLELVYVGDGRMKEELIERVSNGDLEEKVTFRQNISEEELVDLYSESIFCMPSSYEGFGMVYIEAMATGAPVIATHGTAIAEVIEDGESGILTSRDPSDIEESIRKLIEDKKFRRSMSDSGKDKVSEYDWANIAKKTSEYYEEILE